MVSVDASSLVGKRNLLQGPTTVKKQKFRMPTSFYTGTALAGKENTALRYLLLPCYHEPPALPGEKSRYSIQYPLPWQDGEHPWCLAGIEWMLSKSFLSCWVVPFTVLQLETADSSWLLVRGAGVVGGDSLALQNY